jgi:aminoglycoside phosphotransferase (APT) family kinase protein
MGKVRSMANPDGLKSELENALAASSGAVVTVQRLQPVAGGASQDVWLLDVHLSGGPLAGEHALIMRRSLGNKLDALALDLPAEYAVLRAAHAAAVPVPRPFALLQDVAGQPALLMQRLSGETLGRRIVKDARLAYAREVLPEQMGQALAAIHSIDLHNPELASLPAPPPGWSPAQDTISRLYAYLEQSDEPHPVLELALRWLKLHEPPACPPVLVHGDFRLGNVVVDDCGLVGVLDWEFTHIGDPAEDLAWPLLRDWRFGVDERHFAGVGDLMPFMTAYIATGGRAIEPERVFYWEVLGNVRWAVGTLRQARRHLGGAAPNLEFASLGRRCAEMELEILRLLKDR